ncbi:MAG: hypothetical protein J0L99_00175 [Chitinophagales bacterium]|nr:hypothetical protein [Chitinophagales bacterium]
MKNTFQLAAFGILFLLTQACSSIEEPVNANAEIPDNKKISTGRLPGVYPDTLECEKAMASQTYGYGWKNLDSYYRNSIPRYHNNTDYTENLKKHVIALLTLPDLGFFQEADKSTIAFYINEMKDFSFTDTKTMLKYLSAMEGTWPNEKIKAIALESYNKTIQYFKTEMPPSALPKYQAQFDQLKAYGESLSVR